MRTPVRTMCIALVVAAATTPVPLAGPSPEGAIKELPYVDTARGQESGPQKPRLIIQTSPKVDLVMLVAARVDGEQTINRPLPDNPLGGFWSANTRQFGFDEAPTHLRDLRRSGLWGDRLLEYALHLSEPPRLEPVVGWSAPLLKSAQGATWPNPAAELQEFAGEIKTFADKARFVERYEQRQSEYAQMERTLQQHFAGQDPMERNAAFWGVDPAGDAYLIPSPVVNGGYMAAVAVGDRRHQFLAFGPARAGSIENEGFLHHLVYHELSHHLVDPLLRQNLEEIEASQQLWFNTSSLLANQRIYRWPTSLGEHLLRAYNILILAEEDPVLAELAVLTERRSGFVLIRDFLGFLHEYAGDRERWPSFGDYIPEITRRLIVMSEKASDYNPATRAPEFAIVNPGFDATEPGWLLHGWQLSPSGGVAGTLGTGRTGVTRDAAVARDSDASLRLVNDGATSDLLAVEQGPMAVRSGGTVRLSAWVKTEGVVREGTQQKVCGLYLLFKDRAGEVLSRAETDSAVGTLEWTELSAEFTAPAGTAAADIGILLGMSGTAWFDDVKLERLD